MAPLRRYLRITPYSILEVRIYLDNPADLHRWLIHPQRPVLPDVLAAVKPFVLPKLREENARAASRKAGTASSGGGTSKLKGKKVVRDIITTDSFKVSIFLTDLSTPHAVLVRSREFSAKDVPDVRTGTKDAPMMVHEDDEEDADVQVIRQESNESSVDHEVKLEDLPLAPDSEEELSRPSAMGNSNDDVVSISSHDDEDETGDEPPKKKLRLKTSYDGFSIYGRILCLVVTRRDQRTTVTASLASQQKTKTQPDGSIARQEDTHQHTIDSLQTGMRTVDREPEGILEGWMRSTQVNTDNDEITGDNGDTETN